MTQEQFDKQKWGVDMKCVYDERIRDIVSVDFEERLIGLRPETIFDKGDDISWVRCENVELIKKMV